MNPTDSIIKLSSFKQADILTVINDAAQAYKGVIPPDCYHEPYMSPQELSEELVRGVKFYGYKQDGNLLAVMGIQRVKDVTLIRHAYVLTSQQRGGIGKKLLCHLLALADTSQVLVGTWTAAWWAVQFYEKNGFQAIPKESRTHLRQYWTISNRQAETSIVLKLRRDSVTL